MKEKWAAREALERLALRRLSNALGVRLEIACTEVVDKRLMCYNRLWANLSLLNGILVFIRLSLLALVVFIVVKNPKDGIMSFRFSSLPLFKSLPLGGA